MRNWVTGAAAAVTGLVVAGPAFAALTVPTLSTDDLYTIASAVIVVAAAVYVIKRGMGLLGR